MSKVELSALVNGLSGKTGNTVLRRIGNGTLMAARPRKRTSALSVKEKTHHDRFKSAINYAKVKMADPIAKADYEKVSSRKDLKTAYVMAIRDFLKPPTIDMVKTDGYTGKINDAIFIKATDDFKVAAVTVTINLPSGALLESGSATYDVNAMTWKYTATKANATLAGSKVKATAFDVPKNETTVEKVI
jgi:hypothetical protein